MLLCASMLVAGLGFYSLHGVLQTNATQMAPERRGAAVAAFPFIGELQPRSYNDAFSEICRQSAGRVFAWGNSVVSLADACDRLASVPSISRHSRSKIESCLRFHHLLGNVFVFKDHFLRDPALLIELVIELLGLGQ